MANYPTSVTSFSNQVAGGVIQPSHVNTLQDEVNAIEAGLLNGTAPLNSSNSTVAALSVTGGSTFVGSVTISSNLQVSGNSTITGSLTVSSNITVTGGQIAFPAAQSASAGANTLDDYEEGSWTPVIGGASATSGQTYATQVGRYVKIGQFVLAQFDAALSAKGTITGVIQIQGLPFTALNVTSGEAGGSIGTFLNLATSWMSLLIYTSFNNTIGLVSGLNSSAVSATQLVGTDIGNTTQLIGSLTYRANA